MTAKAHLDIRRKLKVLNRWYCEDLGIQHVYIKPRSPHLNGKVERSHFTDIQEFYQRINYTDDIDINQRLEQWEIFYKRPGAIVPIRLYRVEHHMKCCERSCC